MMTHKKNDIVEELREIAPALETLGAHPHFDVPVHYFDAFPDQLLARIKGMERSEAVAAELETVSPLLAGLPKTTPFSLPEGYFQELPKEILTEKNRATEGRVVKMKRNVRLFKRSLIAAGIAGLIAVSAVMISRTLNHSSIDRMMAKISDQEIEDYLTYSTDAFDNENIFTNVSLEQELPSVLPDNLSVKDIDNLLEDNLLQNDPIN